MRPRAFMRQTLAAGFLLLTFLLIHSTANADTIYLKDGTTLKSKSTSYRDNKFTIALGSSSSSSATIAAGDVDRIEFESASGQVSTIYMKDGTVMRGRGTAYRDNQFTMMIGQAASRAIIDIADVSKIEMDGAAGPARAEAVNPTIDAAPNPKAVAMARDTSRHGEPDSGRADRQPDSPKPVPVAGADSPRPRSAGEVLKSVSVSVISRNDWNSSGVAVKVGDRVRISASGTITIDSGKGTRSGPEGVEIADGKKLMSDKPTGALIGVIGTDNDDFIFIGKGTEFVAKRAGILFLSVNEGDLSDNNGSYAATISVQPNVVASNP